MESVVCEIQRMAVTCHSLESLYRVRILLAFPCGRLTLRPQNL